MRLQEPHVCPSSAGDGGGDGESAAAILGETALGRDAGQRAKRGQSCSTSSAMQPAASNVRHADMGEEAGHRVEEENGSCIAMTGEGSRLGARKVPATAQLREHCRQHYRQTEHRRGVGRSL